jgi:hypothetical protein
VATTQSVRDQLWRSSAITLERGSWDVHKEALRGSDFPPPQVAQRTFLHGFLLPFSIMAAMFGQPWLRNTYLRVSLVRMLVVVLVAFVAFSSDTLREKLLDHDGERRPAGIVIHRDVENPPKAPKKKHYAEKKAGALVVTVDGEDKQDDATPAGDADGDEEAAEATPGPEAEAKEAPHKPAVVQAILGGWALLVSIFGVLSMIEALIVTVSRRWDDWLGYHASSLAKIRPEVPFPTPPKLVLFDARWLVRKLKRRVRGYVVMAAGIPLIALFNLVPSVGDALFAIGVTAWSWYWLTIFTAAKSAHAWADDGVAPAPLLIRELHDRSTEHRWLKPVRGYARIWARLTRGLNAPAAVVERNPKAFLGLALARVILSFPGLYLLARPVIPVAAGRLCAESDPYGRFG